MTELEDREQRDEALLRQALEALLGQRGEPDWHTGKQRENAIAALRERLGEGENMSLIQNDRGRGRSARKAGR